MMKKISEKAINVKLHENQQKVTTITKKVFALYLSLS